MLFKGNFIFAVIAIVEAQLPQSIQIIMDNPNLLPTAGIDMKDRFGNTFTCQSIAQNEIVLHDTLPQALNGRCARFSQNEWVYEWCHKQQVQKV